MSTTGLGSLAAALVVLTAVSVGVGAWARLGQGRDVLVVTVRAIVQLAVVGLVIRLVFTTPGLAPLYLLVMVAAATYTSGRRLRRVEGCYRVACAAIVAGAAVTTGAVFATHALAFGARTAVPFSAQVIGGSMTATSLAGQRLIDSVATDWDRVEGWLALGASPKQAVRDLARTAAARALVPALDQTRNVGLVTLPGAFVGLLLGGATPLQAGRLQLLVLVGLVAAETVAVSVGTALLAAPLGRRRPEQADRR